MIEKAAIKLVLGVVLAAEFSISLSLSATAQPQQQASTRSSKTTPAIAPINNAQTSGKSPSADLDAYLSSMRKLVQRYDGIMLSLIGTETEASPGSENDNKRLEAECKQLTQAIEQVKAPTELEIGQGGLAEALSLVQEFLESGGTKDHGFHGAIEVAQQMQRLASEYHSSVLAAIKHLHLPGIKDPFLAEQVVARLQHGQNSVQFNRSASSSDSYVSSGAEGSLADDIRSRKSASLLSPPPSESTSMINGVDGAFGMSGMFNGLAGTDTNGLVDGLGSTFSLNGMLNGAGMSSGTSGMLNDTDMNKSGKF